MTKLKRPTNGVSYGTEVEVLAQDVIDREVIVDFQVNKDLVATVGIVDSLDAVKAQTDLSISYPEAGQVRIADNALIEAIKLANETKADLNLHYLDATAHVTAIDEDNTVLSADATDYATMIALATEILTSYDVHDDDAELGAAWVYHEATESGDHSPTSAVAPTTIAEATTRLNDLKAKYNAHEADTSAHGGAGGTYPVASGDIGTSFSYVEGDKISVIANRAS